MLNHMKRFYLRDGHGRFAPKFRSMPPKKWVRRTARLRKQQVNLAKMRSKSDFPDLTIYRTPYVPPRPSKNDWDALTRGLLRAKSPARAR